MLSQDKFRIILSFWGKYEETRRPTNQDKMKQNCNLTKSPKNAKFFKIIILNFFEYHIYQLNFIIFFKITLFFLIFILYFIHTYIYIYIHIYIYTYIYIYIYIHIYIYIYIYIYILMIYDKNKYNNYLFIKANRLLIFI